MRIEHIGYGRDPGTASLISDIKYADGFLAPEVGTAEAIITTTAGHRIEILYLSVMGSVDCAYEAASWKLQSSSPTTLFLPDNYRESFVPTQIMTHDGLPVVLPKGSPLELIVIEAAVTVYFHIVYREVAVYEN